MPFLQIGDRRLEYAWHGPSPDAAPTLVFLHEGLGCVAMWRDFPQRVIETTGCGALVYTREGYGNSDPAQLPRPVSFMHDEALVTLPEVLAAMKIKKAILVGHSDGGSIALIHAGGIPNGTPVLGLILEAPHVFVEDISIESIKAIGNDFGNGELKGQLSRYHQNVNETFWSWSNIWLDPEFRSWNIEEYLPQITQPVLLLQGEQDQYGTLEQVKRIESGCSANVRTVILNECGHDPHVDQTKRTIEEISKFLSLVLKSTDGVSQV
jgi:pimeloyl-ACP methyl ester carboxylesterase